MKNCNGTSCKRIRSAGVGRRTASAYVLFFFFFFFFFLMLSSHQLLLDLSTAYLPIAFYLNSRDPEDPCGVSGSPFSSPQL